MHDTQKQRSHIDAKYKSIAMIQRTTEFVVVGAIKIAQKAETI